MNGSDPNYVNTNIFFLGFIFSLKEINFFLKIYYLSFPMEQSYYESHENSQTKSSPHVE